MKSVFYTLACLALVGCSSKIPQTTPGYIDYMQDGEMQKIKILSEAEIDAIPEGAGGKYIIDNFGMGVKSAISGLLYPGYTGKKDAKGYFDLGDIKCEYLFLIDSMSEDHILDAVISPRNEQMVIIWPTRFKGMLADTYYKQKTKPADEK